jgi:CRISPR-associated endonuclease/helicase Cas3
MDNKERSRSLWAKKDEISGKFMWLPLPVHLADTMHVMQWLWNNWLSGNQRHFCIHSLSEPDEETACRLAAFLGAVHDIGKATPAFQTQPGYRNSRDLDLGLLEKLEQAGFQGISHLNLPDSKMSHHTIAGEYLLQNVFHAAPDIGSIIGAHHGQPVSDSLLIDDQRAYTRNYYQEDKKTSEVYRRWDSVQRYIFQQALDVSGFHSVTALPQISKPGQVIYSGLLIMADWIASNSDYFPLIPIEENQISALRDRAERGVESWKGSIALQITTYPTADELYGKRFGYHPRDFQKTVYETISRIHDPGIIILEAPMGLGKTEAALAAAEELAAETGSSGLFFGLPTQATSNSMFSRVHHWLDAVTKAYDVKQSLRLSHGKAALNEEMDTLRNESHTRDINIDDLTNGSVYVNEWFAGRKKTILDDFVVGTVDGYLLSALKQKHLALRHLGISKKVVIIDEVHAYDTYMQQYLLEAIQWSGAYHIPLILVSATLPQDRRQAMIQAYLKGMGVKKREIAFPAEMTGNAYPMVSYTDGKEVKVQTDFLAMADKKIAVRKLSEADLPDKISGLLENGGVIGIIVNTVKRAQNLGMMCIDRFGEDAVDILHASFIATDRIRKETELLNSIGKDGKRPKRKIIIGTQVMEQSLDIDFDVMITDLCPMDLLLQRAGRLHRHAIVRPQQHEKPILYVMGTDDQFLFDKGSEKVYGSYYLIRTQYFLPSEIHLPEDIPVLVNEVYGDKPLDLSEELQLIYQKSCKQMKVQQENKEFKAKTYRIDDVKNRIDPERNNLIRWLNNPDQSDCDEKAAAQVRDIAETVEIIALRKIGDGYGTFNSRIDISNQIEISKAAKKIAMNTIRLPNFVTMRIGVEETINELEDYNRKHLAKWQEQPWLKGTLGLIFDENGCFTLHGIRLRYDSIFGLREDNNNGKV